MHLKFSKSVFMYLEGVVEAVHAHSLALVALEPSEVSLPGRHPSFALFVRRVGAAEHRSGLVRGAQTARRPFPLAAAAALAVLAARVIGTCENPPLKSPHHQLSIVRFVEKSQFLRPEKSIKKVALVA